MKKILFLALIIFILSFGKGAAWDQGTWDSTQDNVTGPATNSDNYIPQWNGANTKTLKNGVELSTDGTMGDNSDTAVPTEKAVKTYADTKIPTSQKAAASGVASLDGSSLVVQNPANATATPTASKIPISDGSGKLDGWINAASGSTAGLVTPTSPPALTYYKTIFIPASACTSTATNGADLATNEYATNDINMDFYAFDGTTEQFIEIQFPMPEDWNRGTIKAKFFWSSASGSTATDTVEWEIAGGALSNDDAIDAALGTAQVISDALLADNGTDLQVSGATPALTVGGTPALGDLVHFKISRNVGGTDNMTEDAWLHGIWIQYLANTAVVTW